MLRETYHGSVSVVFKVLTNSRINRFLLMIMVLSLCVSFYGMVARFHEAPFDGVFQTLFALRRMEVGELAGRDFFYFHGNGIPYLLYPIYIVIKSINGQELAASLWSTFFVNIVFLYGPVFIAFWKYYGVERAAAAILIISVINETFFFLGFYNSPLFIGAPMGIRMAPHTFALMVFLWNRHNEDIFPRKMLVALGALLSFGPLLGAEQGVFAIAGCFLAVFYLSKGLRHKIINSSIVLGVSGFLFLFHMVVFWGGLDTIKAMRVISDNQIWVYGVPPNTYFSNASEIFSFSKILAVPSQLTTLLASIVILVMLLLGWSRRLKAALLSMYFGGLFAWLSSLGYVGQHQSAIFMKMLLVIACFILFDLMKRVRQ